VRKCDAETLIVADGTVSAGTRSPTAATDRRYSVAEAAGAALA